MQATSYAAELERWRADTPGCAHRNHLNNAGAALMPQPVIDAITSHIALESEIGGYEAEDSLWYYDRPARLATSSEDRIIQSVHDLLPKKFAADRK